MDFSPPVTPDPRKRFRGKNKNTSLHLRATHRPVLAPLPSPSSSPAHFFLHGPAVDYFGGVRHFPGGGARETDITANGFVSSPRKMRTAREGGDACQMRGSSVEERSVAV